MTESSLLSDCLKSKNYRRVYIKFEVFTGRKVSMFQIKLINFKRKQTIKKLSSNILYIKVLALGVVMS